ncbi:OsmC family protein [Stenotrophomonas sp. NLF4-10]|uniref:OsmC family protein n=1 Tax=Stenotrophomonas sp. NLF4-10 TaxID=2918754 RepID=UPI001EFA861D|nr:OsmC family protein [Stenotrophomonas sp. NLF4-10]MCG8275981.1 OsmC family protein [Stenotrophomonas sp. NLF4-10]
MTIHSAKIHWQLKDGESFADNRYSRAHIWSFDGGTVVPASSSPAVVPIPMSSADAIDPEEALVASLSSCHMLWFLSVAAKRGFTVINYMDKPRGTMGRNAVGKLAMIRVDLAPAAEFSGEKYPTAEEIEAMHHIAHESCFIANSVTADVACRPIHESN